MQPKRKIFQTRQRQLRRRKNVSFKVLSSDEMWKKSTEEEWSKQNIWVNMVGRVDARSLADIEEWHDIKFKPILEKLRHRFAGQRLEILDDGAGESSLKHELLSPNFGGNLHITTTDVRQGQGWPDKVVNVLDLAKKFGKNSFHLVISTAGGAKYSGLPEKAIFQIASVLKPGGMAIVHSPLPARKTNAEIKQLAERLNITMQVINFEMQQLIFTKNLGRRKR